MHSVKLLSSLFLLLIPWLVLYLLLASQSRDSLIKVYASNSEWRRFRSRSKPTRSDLDLPFMIRYSVMAICIEER